MTGVAGRRRQLQERRHVARHAPCHSKASRRPGETGTLLRRHQKTINADSVVRFASAFYTYEFEEYLVLALF
jgi:hypothetical protein